MVHGYSGHCYVVFRKAFNVARVIQRVFWCRRRELYKSSVLALIIIIMIIIKIMIIIIIMIIVIIIIIKIIIIKIIMICWL